MHHHRHALFHIANQKKDLHLVQKSVMIRSMGVALLEMFQPLYLLSAGFSLSHLMFFYAAQYLLSALLAPFVGLISARLGFAKACLLGLSSYSVYLICFALAPHTGFATLVPAAILWAIYESVYWPNYHFNFCSLTTCSSRGSQTGIMNLLMTITRFAAPLIAGLIINGFGFIALFAVALVTIVLSSYPFFLEQTAKPLASEPPLTVIKELLSGMHKLQQVVFFSLGALFFIMEFVWPIVVFQYFPDFGELGIFVTLSAVLGAVTIAVVTRLIDRFSKSKLLTAGTLIYSFGWLMRAFIAGKVSYIAADMVSRVGENFAMTPAYALTYELSERQDKTSFQLQRILMLSVGYVVPALIIALFPGTMLRGMLLTAPVFCLLLLLINRIK